MANQEQLEILKQGAEKWNRWRLENLEISIDLTEAKLFETNLNRANLSGANLFRANLNGAKLREVNLSGADLSITGLSGANLDGANLSHANLFRAKLHKAYLFGANLSRANLSEANLTSAHLEKAFLGEANLNKANLASAFLWDANLTRADLTMAFLEGANLSRANLSGANLIGASLSRAICVETNFSNANMENAYIYGISVWNIKTEGLKQENLKITKGEYRSGITVDNLEVAQFIYLMLNNEKIRDVIGTIAKKGVLILGRFTPERKKILDAIRNKLRELNFLPMMFDFEKVEEKDFTETIKILAGMSRFIIVDISNPKSSPLELQATLPDYKIPFVPIIEAGQHPFAMFRDLTIYPWCLEIRKYKSEESLMKAFQKSIVDRALNKEKEILAMKNRNQNDIKDIEED